MKQKRRKRHLTVHRQPEPKPAPIPRTASVKVGDIVDRWPVTFGEQQHVDRPPMRGRVTYVHPKGRFHLVEFETLGGTLRECFTGA